MIHEAGLMGLLIERTLDSIFQLRWREGLVEEFDSTEFFGLLAE